MKKKRHSAPGEPASAPAAPSAPAPRRPFGERAREAARRAREAARRAVRFAKHDVWDTEMSALRGARRALVRFVRILYLVGRGFKRDECTLHASALTFMTLLSIVPVLALALSLAKAAMDENRLRDSIKAAVHSFFHDTIAIPGIPATPGAEDPFENDYEAVSTAEGEAADAHREDVASPDRYEAEVLLEVRRKSAPEPGAEEASDPASFLRAQFAVVKSYPVIEDAVRAGGLGDVLAAAYGWEALSAEERVARAVRLVRFNTQVAFRKGSDELRVRVRFSRPADKAAALAANTANDIARFYRERLEADPDATCDGALASLSRDLSGLDRFLERLESGVLPAPAPDASGRTPPAPDGAALRDYRAKIRARRNDLLAACADPAATVRILEAARVPEAPIGAPAPDAAPPAPDPDMETDGPARPAPKPAAAAPAEEAAEPGFDPTKPRPGVIDESMIGRLIDRGFDIVARIDFRTLGGVGLLLLVWAVVGVLGNVEKTFNHVWGVTRTRSFVRKITDYLSVVIILPFLLAAASSLPVLAMFTSRLHAAERFVGLGSVATPLFRSLWVLFMLSAAFCFLLRFTPNTHVKIWPGIAGGLVAGLGLSFWLKICLGLQLGVAKYNAFFGSFAMIPILLSWVYVSWVVILCAAEVSYAVQNADSYELETGWSHPSPHAQILLASALLRDLREAVDRGDGMLRLADFTRAHKVSPRLVRTVARELAEAELVAPVEGEPDAYASRIDLHASTLGTVAEALLRHGASAASLGVDRLAVSSVLDPKIRAALDAAPGLDVLPADPLPERAET